MTSYTLPYGHEHISIEVPETWQVDLLEPQPGDPLPDPDRTIIEALHSPMGAIGWEKFVGAKTVGIAINDKTRPVPKPNPIVHLLNHLEGLGFAPDQITLFVGSGTHTPMTPDELPQILDQSIIERFKIQAHDCDRSPLIDLGKSNYGNPIQINADFYNCDLKFSVGNIEPHHFMGFSGGIKTAAIGLAGRATIDSNHAGLTHPHARTGEYNINPLRQEIEEIGHKSGVQFSLGTVLDERKRVLKVFFGSPLAVMDAAIPFVRQSFGVEVSAPYDLVIASPGGAPKDINLYQSQKGLTHAARITRDGGWVFLLAACPEGSGSASYEDYILNADSHPAVIDHFQSGYFQVGPHKALQIAREAVRINIVLVSDIPPKTVKTWKLTPSKPELINDLISWIGNQLPADARVAILPAATRTMTEVRK